jgi:hypothetical protein
VFGKHLRQNKLQGDRLSKYLELKRRTCRGKDSWSDQTLLRALSEVLRRPIVIVTYPVFIQGRKENKCPKVEVFQFGPSTREAVFLHYNGRSHYNTFVPKKPGEAKITYEFELPEIKKSNRRSLSGAPLTGSSLGRPHTQKASPQPQRVK